MIRERGREKMRGVAERERRGQGPGAALISSREHSLSRCHNISAALALRRVIIDPGSSGVTELARQPSSCTVLHHSQFELGRLQQDLRDVRARVEKR